MVVAELPKNVKHGGERDFLEELWNLPKKQDIEICRHMVYIKVYTNDERCVMESAKIFMNGRSEAVRLPKNCRFGSSEVYIKKIGDLVVLIPKEKVWDVFVKSLDGFSDDFLTPRPGDIPQKRDLF